MGNSIRTCKARLYITDIVIFTDETRENTYQLAPGEQLIFGLKRNRAGYAYIVKKTLTSDNYNEASGGYTLTLSTNEMNVPVGMYYYDVALKRSSGELERIIGTTEFEITHSIVLPLLT